MAVPEPAYMVGASRRVGHAARSDPYQAIPDMDLVYAVVAIGAVIAGFIQGLSGFAFALVAMSIWAWVLDPAVAAVLVVFGATVGQVMGAVSTRLRFDARRAFPYLAGGLIGIPLGVGVLPHLDPATFKFGLGMFLVLWCPTMLSIRRLPRVTFGGRAADGMAGVLGGIMGGIGGVSGPIPTLWITMRGYGKDIERALIQTFNLSILSATLVVYTVSGLVTVDLLPLFAVVAAAVLVPVWLGARLYAGIADVAFRRIVLSLLAVSGAMLVASSAGEVLGWR